MPHSPPLHFRRGRVRCPCVLASPRGRPARGLRCACWLAGPRPRPGLRPRICALANGPAPGEWVAVVRAGRRAPGCAQGRGRGSASWLAGPCPRPRSRPHTCALAGGPAPVACAGVAVVRAGRRARARCLVRAFTPPWLRQPCTSRQSVLSF